MSDPPLAANPKFASDKYDSFHGTVSVFNNDPAGSLNPVAIAGIRAEYRMVGEQNYAPAEDCDFTDGSESMLPYSIEHRKSWQINFEARVSRTKEDKKLDIRWWNRAFMGRYRPVRIKLMLEDIEGEECSLVLEYVYEPFAYQKANKKDLEFFPLDNAITCKRYTIHCEPLEAYRGLVKIGSAEISTQRLDKVVYPALKSGKTEIDLKIGQEDTFGEWEWEAYALVDISCRRVYAFKIITQEGSMVSVKRFGYQGYILCPDCGGSMNHVRPISYATEVAKLAPMKPYSLPEYPQDDAIDDFKPPAPPKILPSPLAQGPPLPNGANGHSGIPPELITNLVLINTNLTCIADALEKSLGMGSVSRGGSSKGDSSHSGGSQGGSSAGGSSQGDIARGGISRGRVFRVGISRDRISRGGHSRSRIS